MRIETAAVELAISRRFIFIETRAFAFFWEYTARPVFDRKTRAADA